MLMLKNTRKQIAIQIKDLAQDQKEAPAPRELKLEELNLVVGGARPNSGFLCSATQGGPSEECWQE